MRVSAQDDVMSDPDPTAGGQGVQCGGEDVSRLLDDNMIASTDVRLVTQLTAHAGARRPTH